MKFQIGDRVTIGDGDDGYTTGYENSQVKVRWDSGAESTCFESSLELTADQPEVKIARITAHDLFISGDGTINFKGLMDKLNELCDVVNKLLENAKD